MSAVFILSAGSISKSISANAGYFIALQISDNGVVQSGLSGAGGAAGWLVASWAGAKIGGNLGAIVGGPLGLIVGAGLGAA